MKCLKLFVPQICFVFPAIIRNLEVSEPNESLAKCVAEASKRLFEIPDSIAVYLSINKIYEVKTVVDISDIKFEKMPRSPNTKHCHWGKEYILMIPITPKIYDKVIKNVHASGFKTYETAIDSSGHVIDIQDQILKSIHKKKVREISVFKTTKFEYDNVLVIMQYQYFKDHLKSLMMFAMNLRVLVVLLADNPTAFMARRVLQEMSKPDKFIKDAVVIYQDRLTGVVKLYTWLPYEPPSGKCGKFQDVLFLDDCVGGVFKYNSNIHPRKDVEQLHGCTIGYCGGSDHPPLSVSDTKYEIFETRTTIVKGMNANMIKLIAEKLNITFHRTIYSEKPPHFEICSISSTSLEKGYSLRSCAPYFALKYTFFVRPSDLYPRWTSLIRVFTWTTWLCIFLCMFLFAIFAKWALRSGALAQNSLDVWSIILGV